MWSHLCVAHSKGQRGQNIQMFPITLEPWQDLPGHPNLRLSLPRIKEEGQKQTKSALYWRIDEDMGGRGVETGVFIMLNPTFYGFKGKSLTSTRYDTTDHIPVMDSLQFGGSWRGKSSWLDKINKALLRRKSPTNLWLHKMINSDTNKRICYNKTW